MPVAAPRAGRVLNEITAPRRFFFGVIALAAAFVAYLGLAAPASIDRTFTWAALPPLHARFVGMLYLFGAVYMVGCILASRWRQVSPALPAIGIFTSLLLLVTLLNLEAFDFGLGPVWVWTVSYVVYPAIAFALAWTARGRVGTMDHGPALPRWASLFLRAQAVVFAVLGVLLLVARDAMVDVWPWPIDPGLAQFYGGPFLAYAFCSWRYAGRVSWREVAAIVPAMLVFTAGTVVVSLLHRGLFAGDEPATWIWFGGFGAAAAVLLVMTVRALSPGPARLRAGRGPTRPAPSASSSP
ncbi:MAG: hypothetical protein QOG77_1796 [Solirubrobacteraceae bacterium]|jgi:hypothetical protein|nr:hypothetical protein [Solirubrobacteraceae bacterium]